MKTEEFYINSSSDDLNISLLVVFPNTPPKAIVQIAHGMCEHKERYIPFAGFLAENGYITVINDHRGHGKTIANNNDLGYFYSGGYQAAIDDLHIVTLWAKQQYPNLPIYLFGHSMGSMLVRSYLKQYDFELSKLVVCGCVSYNRLVGFGKFTARLIAHLKGDHHRSKLIQKLTFGRHNKNITNPQSANAWLCTDNNIVLQYDNDPLCNFIFTANGFYNLFKLMQDTYSNKGWKTQNKNIPIYFIAGADDPCIGNAKQFNKAVEFLRNRGYQSINSKLLPNMRHEILNEPDKTAWTEILNFFNQ